MQQDGTIYQGMEINLEDEDGKVVSYTLMDAIEYDNHTYVYLIRTEEKDSDEPELYITEYEETADDIIFNPVENEVLLDELYDVFMEENPQFGSDDDDES